MQGRQPSKPTPCTTHSYMHTDDVATRFSSIVTLYLALMAVQYVVNADLPASSYSMPSQQLILATYALYFALAIESFAVYKIVLTKERRDAESKQVCFDGS